MNDAAASIAKLKAYAGKGKPTRKAVQSRQPISIATLLYQHLLRREKKRFSSNENGWLNVTDIWDSCMRQIYLAAHFSVPVTQVIPQQTWMKFRMGEALEAVLKEEMRLLGLIVDHEHVRHEELKIIGHEDVRFKNGLIGEIKCMDPAVFRLAKKYPLPSHKFQVETYVWLDNQYTYAPLLSFSYGNETMPFREQDIAYNIKTPEQIKRTVAPLREAETGGPLPGRCCTSNKDRRAVTCPVARQCFQMDAPREKVLTIKEAVSAK